MKIKKSELDCTENTLFLFLSSYFYLIFNVQDIPFRHLILKFFQQCRRGFCDMRPKLLVL